MSNNQQFAIVPVPSHPGHAKDYIQSDSILIGPMSECLEGIRQSVAHTAMLRRLDEGQKEAERVERTQAATRIANCAMLVDGLDRIARRLDSYEAELAIKKQREADAAEQEEQERIQAALDELPDPDDPTQHMPGGELSPLQPKPQDDDEGQGDLPRELEKGAPPPIGNLAEPEGPEALGHPYDPKQVPPPTSPSFW